MEENRPQQAEVYLRHRLGRAIPVSIRVTPLHDAQGKVVGGHESFHDNTQVEALLRQLRRLRQSALIDGERSIGNRRYANITLRTKLNELQRYGWPFGIILGDVDRFKHVNDTYGHEAGDTALRIVAAAIAQVIRNPRASLFRWGGDEFLIVAGGVTPQHLSEICERVRLQVLGARLPVGEKDTRVSLSGPAWPWRRLATTRAPSSTALTSSLPPASGPGVAGAGGR